MRPCTEAPAAPAAASTASSGVDPEQLRAVFQLCDPHGTGFVSLHTLLRLGREYCSDHNAQEVARVLQQLDPAGRGVIGFTDFCRGVTAVIGGREARMMAPVYQPQPALPTDAAATATQAAGAPTFVLQDCDADSAIGDTASPDMQAKSQCSSMSDGEQFECYGENVELELEPGSPPRQQNGEECRSPGSTGLTRHTWLRTSLRRSAPSSQHENLPNRRWGSFRHSGKRLGSNALASQLYRSSSFNSSGRSSTCDTADDMCSDVSLEEDVLDLSHKNYSPKHAVLEPSACEDLISMWHELLERTKEQDIVKVQLLQQQVSVLADNQTSTDDRYTRAKQDSAALQARVHMLEEQLREAEVRAEERLQEEQRRHRELMARVDREKELHVENYSIRLQTLELEVSSLRDETSRLRAQLERLRGEKEAVEERLAEAEAASAALHEEAQAAREGERRARDDSSHERAANAQLIEELSRDLDQLRKERGLSSPSDDQHTSHIAELQCELDRLRLENKSLRETNEDLQAQLLTRGVEEGRNLLGAGNSIAAELEAMSGEELSGSTLGHQSYEKMKTALKEQQEVNSQLRSYIDGMLLNIVENYPQLLEVKSN